MIDVILHALFLAAPVEATPTPTETPKTAAETPKTAAEPTTAATPFPDDGEAPLEEQSTAQPSPEPAKSSEPKLATDPKPTTPPPAATPPESLERSRPDYRDRDLAPAKFRVDVLVAGGTQRMADPAYRAFDDGLNVPGPTLLVRADARLGASNVFLGGGVGYRRFATEHFILGDATTRIVAQDLMIFGRLSWAPLEGIEPFVEVGTGPSFVDTHVVSTLTSHQRDTLALFDALGGLALSLPRTWHPSDHVTGGFEFGLGYTLRSQYDIHPGPVVGDDVISTTSVGFGDLRLHGLLWRAGLFVRFL